jgi:hypothetical protein
MRSGLGAATFFAQCIQHVAPPLIRKCHSSRDTQTLDGGLSRRLEAERAINEGSLKG